MERIPFCLFVLLSVNIVPSFQQNDSLCTNHSPSAKHFNTFHYCYWLTPSNGTADNGSIACQAAGGYIGFIESDPDLLSFIHDGLDNHWSQTDKVFVGLRSWDSNNAFTHWDREPIYTLKWDYTAGEPDGIIYNEFCVALSVNSSHLWHNERCDKIFQSLCYCRLDLGSAKHICSSPIVSNVTSSSLPVVSQSFLITTAVTSLTPSPASAYSTIPWSIPVSSSLTSPHHLSPAASVMYGSTYLFSSSISNWTFTTVTSTTYVTSCYTTSSTSSIYSSVASSYASCCPCRATSNSTNSTNDVPLTEDLKVDKTTTSRYLRTKNSAADDRPLSQFLGTSAIIIIVVIIGAIVAWDVTIIAKQVMNKYKQCKREKKKKLKKGRRNSLEMEH
uniref:Uncharacterized protein LOC111137977 n=1 Tax=Crassostrea virginica TaxID=6565 RepID=A0A8B8EZQ9_CRAVI|nr:uncharacterized protein LOC111137977 [Crassostrea virginica]